MSKTIKITTTIGGKEEKLVSLTRAAELLAISRQGVLGLINNGEIRAVRTSQLGQDVLYLAVYRDVMQYKKQRGGEAENAQE